MIDFISVIPAATAQVQKALSLDVNDFEDALRVTVAISANMDAIITRNEKHLKGCPLTIFSASAFLRTIDY